MRDVKNYPQLAFEPSNIMPAHCSCNRARGNREMVPVGRLSRSW